jgi:hypothetical protein
MYSSVVYTAEFTLSGCQYYGNPNTLAVRQGVMCVVYSNIFQGKSCDWACGNCCTDTVIYSESGPQRKITYKKCGGIYIPFDNAEYFHNPTPF